MEISNGGNSKICEGERENTKRDMAEINKQTRNLSEMERYIILYINFYIYT